MSRIVRTVTRPSIWLTILNAFGHRTYVASFFFLHDSYKFAAATPTSATLIGVSLTSVIFLTGIAFALRKGNVVETSLMMAYLTFQIYYLTDGPNPWAYLGSLQPSGPPQLVQRCA